MAGEESAAANGVIAAINAAIIASQKQNDRHYVPQMIGRSVLTQFIYFITASLTKAIKLTVNTTKVITLKVFGSG